MAEALLSVQNMRVQFGDFLAVDDISFEMHAGQLLGLIGPNGAGKSTALRGTAGLQPLTTGDVYILGHDVSTDPEFIGSHLAFTPDTPALYDTLTVAEFLRFVGRCYDFDRGMVEDRIDHWLKQLWLTDKKDEKIAALSRGMRQRLAVARSLLPDPHVVLMDEPAAGLDPKGRVEFRNMLASLRDQGKAVIVSSHILADLAEYCTHIAFMQHGRFRNFGTVQEVIEGHRSEKTRYRVRLARRMGDLKSRLERIPELGGIATEVGDYALTIEYPSGDVSAGELLKALMAADLPICEFRSLELDLEQAYLSADIRQVD